MDPGRHPADSADPYRPLQTPADPCRALWTLADTLQTPAEPYGPWQTPCRPLQTLQNPADLYGPWQTPCRLCRPLQSPADPGRPPADPYRPLQTSKMVILREFLAKNGHFGVDFPRSDLPPPPTITVMPLKTQYLLGDTISIQCSAPWTQEKLQGFQFSGSRGWAMEVRTSKRSYSHHFNITGPKDGGPQACCYVIKRPRGPLCSQESKAIIINVKDHPPQPTLTLKPSSGLTIEGQPLVFFCTAPEGIKEPRFYIYKENLKLLEGINVTVEATKAQFLVGEAKQNHTGNFSCGYEEMTEGRWIPSYLSQVLEVLIKEAASPPHLAMEPSTGVVDEDHPLQLTCKASRDIFRPRFHFYRNGLEMPPGQGGFKIQKLRNASHLLVSRTSRSFSGNFSCGVEEDVEGTWVVAPRSRALSVTIRAAPPQLLPLVAGTLSGGLVLLLGFLLAVWLWRRRRGGVHWKDFQDKEDSSSYPMAKVSQG
ncbi:uncharacterized protein LOC128899875 [Dryobates pubescens]|uniref:uncharacterized protein LOC128899875 n=1 Tax=Dryobates pubescens TaxID=118200 RepID=UPI0023BA1163|nr:uncharacterized protein LOC128899875 [Dryobates pubescens]